MKIVEAYRCTPLDSDAEGGLEALVWKYEDGTGNVAPRGTAPALVRGVAFEAEPSGFLDEAYYTVRAISPEALPACARYEEQSAPAAA